MIVYLAGFMSADPQTRKWREEAAALLALRGIETLDPFRGKQALSVTGLRCSHPTSLLTARDKMDIDRSDVILLNAIGAEALPRQSIGTWAEFGFAGLGMGLPIIVIATAAEIREHPFIERWGTLVVDTLSEAVKAIVWLL